jgi:hypothetical protein
MGAGKGTMGLGVGTMGLGVGTMGLGVGTTGDPVIIGEAPLRWGRGGIRGTLTPMVIVSPLLRRTFSRRRCTSSLSSLNRTTGIIARILKVTTLTSKPAQAVG